MFKINVSIENAVGDLATHEIAVLDSVIGRTVEDVAKRGQVLLRRDTGAALGQRVANAWRMETYDNANEGPAHQAGFIWSKAPKIIRAFSEGIRITGRFGNWLAIPLPAAGRAPARRRMTPALFEQLRGLKLRMIYSKGRGSALLVTDGARLSGHGRGRMLPAPGGGRLGIGRAQRAARGGMTIPIFVLVKSIKVPKRLELAAHRRSIEADLYNSLVVNLRNAD